MPFYLWVNFILITGGNYPPPLNNCFLQHVFVYAFNYNEYLLFFFSLLK